MSSKLEKLKQYIEAVKEYDTNPDESLMEEIIDAL
jgi:hypothetical protein